MKQFTRAEEVEQYCREACSKQERIRARAAMINIAAYAGTHSLAEVRQMCIDLAERDATYAVIAAHIVTQDRPR